MSHRLGGALIAAFGGLIALAAPRPAAAQAAEPFGRLEIAVGATKNVGRTPIHDYWDVGTGMLLRIGTPFYLGSAALTLERSPFTPHTSAQPYIDVLAILLEWNGELALLPRLRAFGGANFGYTIFHYLHPEEYFFLITESEVGAGLQAGLRVRLVGDLGLVAMATHQRTRTHIPIGLSYLAVGAEYRFATPWLHDFLQ